MYQYLWICIDALYERLFLKALGGARPRFFTRAFPGTRPTGQPSAVKAASCGLDHLLVQKKETKENDTRRLAPC